MHPFPATGLLIKEHIKTFSAIYTSTFFQMKSVLFCSRNCLQVLVLHWAYSSSVIKFTCYEKTLQLPERDGVSATEAVT
jgi:hypothetical protein